MDAGQQDSEPRTANSMDEGESSDFNLQSGNNSGTNTPHNQRVKPVLKKNDDMQGEKRERHLKWDEHAIEEHDKLRGTRMKIDEPNTPYANYDSGAESDDSRRTKSPNQNRVTLSWDVLQTKLDSVAAVRAQFPSSPSSHADTEHDTDVEEDQKKEMRKMEFQEHRKRHYNEMEAVRRFRTEQSDDKDDVDGDADDENGDD
mmetsp:Transcript_3833/g.5055  ORF Transcript_3833/g.5055 Transcript_3833/m.5055 type:complete len:201 (-) Transcript_3833:45-647(-)